MLNEEYKEYAKAIKTYCEENDLDYEGMSRLNITAGIDFIRLQTKEKKAVLDVCGYDMNNLVFEPTELINEYYMNRSAVAV